MLHCHYSSAFTSIHAAENKQETLFNSLSPRRSRRIAAYAPARRNASLAADLLARTLAGDRCGLSPESLILSETEKGQPFFPKPHLKVSLSHAGDYAAAAVGDIPLGVDLEKLRPVSQGVYRRVLDNEEQNWVLAVPAEQEARFLRLWTMKEAYVKMLGQGFWEQPIFHAAIQDRQPVTDYPGFHFIFPDAPEGYVLTLCLQEENLEPPDLF